MSRKKNLFIKDERRKIKYYLESYSNKNCHNIGIEGENINMLTRKKDGWFEVDEFEIWSIKSIH